MNGTLYDFVNGCAERRVLGPLRTEVLWGLHGEIVEIGAGTGANLRLYNSAAHVLIIEPDVSMARRAEKKLQAPLAATVELRIADDRSLDSLPGASVDAVVSTLVLCSVEDPAKTLKRAKRVLKGDGALVLIEHVRSTGAFGRLQDAIAPLWWHAAGGCYINRDTGALLADAGFDTTTLQNKALNGVSPIRKLIYGRCRHAIV